MEKLTRRDTVLGAEEILGKYFPVLDHGFISLVDYMGSDRAVEQAARVSYGAGTRQRSETRGLLRYMLRHGHTSPFEQVELKFHVSMPIFIARQWIRHRTANVNEYSGRYSLMPMLFYTPEEWRLQSKSNKQGSEGLARPLLQEGANHTSAEIRQYAQSNYEWLAQNDVARELARIDLPLSTYTQWYWKIDLHNLMHFLRLRADSHAQKEIRDYAEIMAGMVKRLAPISYEAWRDYQLGAHTFSRQEMKILQALVFRTEGSDYPEDHPEWENLSKREVDDFCKKLEVEQEVPDFELDLSQMKEGKYFEDKVKAATPEIDRA